jgi:2-polyprenyl-3-methyl-5-hydroxy-6-metoxy-1,4-benzoquinol methylase
MTREPQYAPMFQATRPKFGAMSADTWERDPKRLGMMLARYKHSARIIAGAQSVLEVGCGDGFGSCVLAQFVPTVMGCDFDPAFVAEAAACGRGRFFQHDMTKGPPSISVDAVVTLDVLEHIPRASEDAFLTNIAATIGPHGLAVIGTPNQHSQWIASQISRAGHVNCKTPDELRDVLREHFHAVVLFGVNDETLHTGHDAMCHYLLALCFGGKTFDTTSRP